MDETNSREEEDSHNKQTEENSWWGSLPVWFQAAKEKSSTALVFMRRDLSELSQTVQTDAAAAISSTAALLKDKLMIDSADSVASKAKESITSILGTITEAFIPQRELEEAEMVLIRNSEPITLDWWQGQLHLIRKDPKTYCHEPEGPPELYENWLESFNIDEHEDEIEDLMSNCSVVRALYEDLVPSAVSHLEFWQRYHYRVHLLTKAETKRAELLKRADAISLDDIDWEEGDMNPKLSRAGHISDNKSYDIRGDTSQNHESVGLLNNDMVNKVGTADDISKSVTSSASDDFGQVPQKNLYNSSRSFVVSDLNTERDTSENYELVVNSIDSVKQVVVTEMTVNQHSKENTGARNKDPSELILEDNRPASPQSNESASKDYSTGDEWEKDFDLDAPESDLKLSEEIVKHLVETDEDDEGWVSW